MSVSTKEKKNTGKCTTEICIYNIKHDKNGRGYFCYFINDFIAPHECDQCPAFNAHLFSHAQLDELEKRREKLLNNSD